MERIGEFSNYSIKSVITGTIKKKSNILNCDNFMLFTYKVIVHVKGK